VIFHRLFIEKTNGYKSEAWEEIFDGSITLKYTKRAQSVTKDEEWKPESWQLHAYVVLREVGILGKPNSSVSIVLCKWQTKNSINYLNHPY